MFVFTALVSISRGLRHERESAKIHLPPSSCSTARTGRAVSPVVTAPQHPGFVYECVSVCPWFCVRSASYCDVKVNKRCAKQCITNCVQCVHNTIWELRRGGCELISRCFFLLGTRLWARCFVIPAEMKYRPRSKFYKHCKVSYKYLSKPPLSPTTIPR